MSARVVFCLFVVVVGDDTSDEVIAVAVVAETVVIGAVIFAEALDVALPELVMKEISETLKAAGHQKA